MFKIEQCILIVLRKNRGTEAPIRFWTSWHRILSTLSDHIEFQMKRTFLGEFEEVILLTVAILGENAYAVTITQELENQTGRIVGFSSVHTTLQRLEEKNYVSSKLGGATAERGGRRKRFFEVSALGRKALVEVQQTRQNLWSALPSQMLELMGA